jgi:hypothetical protein
MTGAKRSSREEPLTGPDRSVPPAADSFFIRSLIKLCCPFVKKTNEGTDKGKGENLEGDWEGGI